MTAEEMEVDACAVIALLSIVGFALWDILSKR